MSDTLFHMAWLLDQIQSIEAEPEKLEADANDCSVTYNFDDLSPTDRIKVKRLAGVKLEKSSYSGNLNGYRKVTVIDNGIPRAFSLHVFITSVYECKTVCTPKHHTREAEEAFLEDTSDA
jgi:hypothetical protein